VVPSEKKYDITDFEFMETIGIGNFGNVVRVINKITKKEYAMKQVKKETILVMKQADHLISEVKTLKSNDTEQCPFVVGHVGTYKDKDYVYI